MRNPENINRSNMKDFMADDKKVINRLKDRIVSIFTKQKIVKVGNMRYKGLFDEQGNFVEGTIYTGNSCKRTGKFEKRGDYDVLREGRREYNSGLIEDGKFNEYEMFVEGERCTPNGIIYKGRFDVNTGRVYDGEVIYTDGKTVKINKK